MGKTKQVGVLGLAALAGLAVATQLPSTPTAQQKASAAIYATSDFSATAQPATADTLLVTKSGVWTLAVNETGVPSLVPYAGTVIRLDGVGTNPTPVPTPTVPLEIHRLAVQAATGAVTDPNKANTKTALAKLWETTAGLPVTDVSQLKQATDTIFNALGLPAVWVEWKKAVDKSAAPFTALDDARKAWQITADVLKQP